MRKTLSIAAIVLLFCSSSAWAGPTACARALIKLPGKAKSIIDNEGEAFKNACAAKLACKSSCKDARKEVKKSVRSFGKQCKAECKNAYTKVSKDKSKKKEAKKEKKACVKMCKSITKDLKKFSKDSKKDSCNSKCKPLVTSDCKTAQRKLATKIIATGIVSAVKIGAACSVPAP
jgi:hypothetical protein